MSRIKAGVMAALLVLCGSMLFAACKQEPVPENPVKAPEELLTDDWHLTTDWQEQEGKNPAFLVESREETAAWNRTADLSGTSWSISAEYGFQAVSGSYGYGRLLFGDRFENICLAVTVKYDPAGKKTLLMADQYSAKGWKNVYTSDWLSADGEQPLKLKVNYAPGNTRVDLTLSQGKTDLLKENTDKLSSRVTEMFERYGLGVHKGKTQITDVTARVVKKQDEETAAGEKRDTETIILGERAASEEWEIGENAIHFLENGKPAVVIDGYGTNEVWNKAHVLEDAWCFETKVTFGSTMQGACCARFMFGPSVGGSTRVLVTVEYSGSRQVEAFMESNKGDWVRIGSTDDWIDCSNNTITVKLYKMAGVNRVCMDLMDHGTVLLTMASDELEEDLMSQVKRHGLMVYSSQVKFSDFSFQNSDEGCTLPPVTEKVYAKVTSFETGEPKTSEIWQSNAAAVYYEDPELGDALVIDSRGDTYCYYDGELGSAWKLSANLDYGTYYGSTASTRIALADAAHDMTGLLSLYFSPKNSQVRLQMESRFEGSWTQEYVYDWNAGEKQIAILMERTGPDTLHLVLTGRETGRVLLDTEVTMQNDALGRTVTLGLGTLGSVTRWTAIDLEP